MKRILARRLMAATAVGAALAASPLAISVEDGSITLTQAPAAFAKGGDDGGSSGSGGGDDGDRGDSSGSGGDDGPDDDGDRSGSGSGDDGDADRSGSNSGGDDDDHDDDRVDDDDDDNDDDDRGRGGVRHFDPETGARIEVSRGSIEVIHANGIKVEIEDGRFEMKDALGRTIVERPATRADFDEIEALLR